MNDFNDMFYGFLFRIQQECPDLIDVETDIYDDFHLARSFRRGARTRAQLADIPSSVIEWIKGWGTGTEVLVKGPMRIIFHFTFLSIGQ